MLGCLCSVVLVKAVRFVSTCSFNFPKWKTWIIDSNRRYIMTLIGYFRLYKPPVISLSWLIIIGGENSPKAHSIETGYRPSFVVVLCVSFVVVLCGMFCSAGAANMEMFGGMYKYYLKK